MKNQGWLVIAALGFFGAGGVHATVPYRTTGMTAAQRDQLKSAVAEAYARASTCDALANERDLQERALAVCRSGDLSFHADGRDPNEPYECAYTPATGFLSGDTIYLRPAAFGDGCGSLASTVFHEVLHVSMPFSTMIRGLFDGGSSEEAYVTHLEHACFPEFYSNVRGLQPPPPR
jgi:hypothetical protein